MKKVVILAAIVSLFAAPAFAGSIKVKGSLEHNNANAASGGIATMTNVTGSGAALGGAAITGGIQSTESAGMASATAKGGKVKTMHDDLVTTSGLNGSGAIGGAAAGTLNVSNGTSASGATAHSSNIKIGGSVKLHNLF